MSSGRQPLREGATGMWWVEVLNILQCYNRVLLPKMASVLSSRNPAVSKPSSLPTPLPQAAHDAPQPCQQEPTDQVSGQCEMLHGRPMTVIGSMGRWGASTLYGNL